MSRSRQGTPTGKRPTTRFRAFLLTEFNLDTFSMSASCSQSASPKAEWSQLRRLISSTQGRTVSASILVLLNGS